MPVQVSTREIHAAQPKRRNRGVIAAIVVVAVLLAAAGAVFGRQLYSEYQHRVLVSSVIDTDTFYPGIVVQGVDLGGKTMEEARAALKDAEDSLRGQYDVKIESGGKSWDITQDSLDFSFDTDKVLGEAYAYARTGDRELRFQQVQALKEAPRAWSITKTIEGQSLKTPLRQIADSVTTPATEPAVSGFDQATKTFQYTNGVNGGTADAEKLYVEVMNVLNSNGSGTVQVPVTSVPFKTQLSQIQGRMKELGTYSTVSKNSAAGTHNMALALSTVNGTEIKPGETFSFLGKIGPGDASQGYEKAGAILNGKLVEEDGGGICQASTTIYGAALRSNMKIVERYNHSIPSSYCPIGQDATVSYPNLDFKFQNTGEYPVFLVTETKGKTMTATLYGYQPPEYDSVEVTSKITQTLPVSTEKQYAVDPSLPKGTIRLDTKARAGYRATATRIFYLNGKVVKTENLPSSYYKPQPAFYSYGKGTVLPKSGGTVSSKPSSSKPASSAASAAKPASSAPAASSSVTSAPASGGQGSGEPVQPDAPVAPDVPNDDVTVDGTPAA